MPDSIRSCGELIAPPARMTSRPAKARTVIAAFIRVFNADGAMPLKQDTIDEGADFNAQVSPPQNRSQIGDCGAAAAAVADCDLSGREALLLAAIEIVGPAVASGGARRRKSFNDGIGKASPPRRERAITAAILVRAAVPGFLAPEIGQHMRIGPLRQATGRPPIVVAAMAPHIRHRIDRGRAADDFAARDFDPPAVHARLGLGRIHPIVHAPRHHAAPGQRDVYPGIAVPSASLEHQDPRSLRSAGWRACSRRSRRPR